jgi:hypothetical protein
MLFSQDRVENPEMTEPQQLFQKCWIDWNGVRDDGVCDRGYWEQITFLHF